MVFLVRGRGAENIEEKFKTDRKKTLMNEDKQNEKYKESQIATMSISGVTFVIKNFILLKNIVVKDKKVKSSLYHHISFAVFIRCRIFETQ